MIASSRHSPHGLLPCGRILRLVVVSWMWFGVRGVLAREERLLFSDAQRITWYPPLTDSKALSDDCSEPATSWHAVPSSDEKTFPVHTCNRSASATVRFYGSAFKLVTGLDGEPDKLVLSLNGTFANYTFSYDSDGFGVFALNNLETASHVVDIRFNANETTPRLAMPMMFKSMTVNTPSGPKAGVIAGAVVGAAVGSFIITVLAWILFRRYARRNKKLFPLNEPPENRIDPLVIPQRTRPPSRRLRGISRAGTSTFSRLHSLRLRDGFPHFRAPPSYNPPSTIETANVATSPVTMLASPASCRLTASLSRNSNRVSAPPTPKKTAHPVSIREAYEVTPFSFPQQQQGVPKEITADIVGDTVPPIHVQAQLEMYAKRRGGYPEEKVAQETNFALLDTIPTLPQCVLDVDAEDQPRPTVGQRRGFFVVNKSSISTLRSSGVPAIVSNQQTHNEITPTEPSRDGDDLFLPRGVTNRKWQKSKALPRIDDNIDEEAPNSSRPLIDDMEIPAPKPLLKKTGTRVFFTTNPSSLSSSSISSRTMSQARNYIKRKRRKQDDADIVGEEPDFVERADIQPSTLSQPPARQTEGIDSLPTSIPARRAPIPTRGVLIDAPVPIHIVTPQSRNNTQLDLIASTGGIPSTVSAGLSDERSEDFDLDSSSGRQSSINRHHEARRSLSPAAAAEMGALARGVAGGRQRQRRGSKTVFYATNPSTISEPSIISGEVEVSSDGKDETKKSREEALVSPLSDVSSMPRPRLDKGKGRELC